MMFLLVLIDAICFTPSNNLLSDPVQCSFFVATLPSNRPAKPVQKGSCFLRFLNAHREETLDIQNGEEV